MIKTFNYLFVTCFGIGSIRFAPGTITSLITTVFLYSLFHIINLSNNTILIILLIVFIYSFYAVSEYIKSNENKDPNESDITYWMFSYDFKSPNKDWVPENKNLLAKKRARNFLVFILYLNAFGIFLLLNSFTAHLLNFIVNPEFSYPV